MSKQKESEDAVKDVADDAVESTALTKAAGTPVFNEKFAMTLANDQSGTPTDFSQFMTPEEHKRYEAASSANIGMDEIQLSRLAILQSKSPELDANPKAPGYEEGQIIDNQNRQIYSVKTLPPWMRGKVDEARLEQVHVSLFVPVFKMPTELIRWKDRNTEGKGQHWKTLDPKELMPFADGTNKAAIRGTFLGGWKAAADAIKKSPPVTTNTNILGFMINPMGEMLSNFLLATFSRTNAQVGQKFVNALMRHKMHNLPTFGLCYYIYTSFNPGKGSGSYWQYGVIAAGRTPANTNLIRSCKEMSDMLSDPVLGKTNQEGLLMRSTETFDEDSEAGGGDETTPPPDGEQVPF